MVAVRQELVGMCPDRRLTWISYVMAPDENGSDVTCVDEDGRKQVSIGRYSKTSTNDHRSD